MESRGRQDSVRRLLSVITIGRVQFVGLRLLPSRLYHFSISLSIPILTVVVRRVSDQLLPSPVRIG